MKIFKRVLICIAVSICLLLTIFLVYSLSVTADVRLQAEKLSLNSICIRVFDHDGKEETGGVSDKNTVPYEKFPKSLIHAFLATEDRRFYSHHGFDVKRMAKAFLTNLSTFSLKEGASTISQQLIKNTHLTGEKTIKRKLQEMKLTAQLERQYSKEAILEKYLNTIYFGHNNFGVAQASAFYFKRPVEELTLDECATLAGMTRSPNNYSPFKNPQRCLARRNSVLKFMLDEGYINMSSYQTAKESPLPVQTPQTESGNSYFQLAYDELESIFEEKNLQIGGDIRIYTYLQPEVQKELISTVQTTETNKSAGILDNRTNGFIAFHTDANDLHRSPASTLKPLAVYAPAIQENLISPATPILDEETNFGGYSPKNYNGKFNGYVSVRESLSKSLNVPSVKILNSLGTGKAAVYLDKMDLHIQKEDEHLALALGGIANGFSLTQLLSAYSTFPNEGVYTQGAFIKKIIQNNKTVYERTATKTTVFDRDTAYLVTDMLRTATKTGTAKKLKSLPFQIAAKTGTAGTAKGNTDAYAIAYTPSYTTGVWLGLLSNQPIPYTGGGLPCEMLSEINAYLYKHATDIKANEFPLPSTVARVRLDKQQYDSAHKILLADDSAPQEYSFEELFKTSMLPTEKSFFFSNPTIPIPKITYQNLSASIYFDDQFYACYRYKIQRTDGKTTKTVYDGEYRKVFTDNDLQPDQNYIYTIIPYCNEHAGTPVVLPQITTKQETFTPKQPPEIVEKPWWKY